MTLNRPRILVVDDEVEIVDDVVERLRLLLGDDVAVMTSRDFSEAEERLTQESFDLVILDLLLNTESGPENRGSELYSAISATRWVPVIFHTARPNDVNDLSSPPLIQVVPKGFNGDLLMTAVSTALDSGIPQLSRDLLTTVEDVLRSFLRDEVSKNFDRLPSEARAIPQLLFNRLSAFLANKAWQELQKAQGAESLDLLSDPAAALFYYAPPIVDDISCGDLITDGESAWWLVLTPACDLTKERGPASAEFVRIAPCHPLDPHHPVMKAKDPTSGLHKAMVNDGRYAYLPRFLDVPEMMADCQAMKVVPYADLKDWSRQATIAAPFLESILQSSAYYMSRIGIPSFNRKAISKRLTTP